MHLAVIAGDRRQIRRLSRIRQGVYHAYKVHIPKEPET